MTEATIVLTVLTLLGGMTAPAVDDYVARAQLVSARHDVKTIGVSLVRLMHDVAGEGERPGGWATFDLLVGAGNVPVAADATEWTQTGARVGLLDQHLMTNGAGYTVHAPRLGFGWRGAYLQEPVKADPWGNRYSANVAAMDEPHLDTLVLSAGPDGRIDAPFRADGVAPAGDDVRMVLATSGSH